MRLRAPSSGVLQVPVPVERSRAFSRVPFIGEEARTGAEVAPQEFSGLPVRIPEAAASRFVNPLDLLVEFGEVGLVLLARLTLPLGQVGFRFPSSPVR